MAATGGMALAMATAVPSQAQNVQVPPGNWTVDYGNIRCSLARRTGGAGSPIVILSSFLGRDEPELLLMRDGAEALPSLPSRMEVVLGPNNLVRRGTRRARRVEGGRVVRIDELGEGFIERFAESQMLRIRSGSRLLLQLPTPNAAAAVTALKACNDDLLQSWGIDTAARRTWQQLPRLASGSITSSDYPDEAARIGQRGTVVVRFTVGTDGRASGCSTVVTSHFAPLDAHTCRLMAERLRFQPAVDAQGRVIAATYIQTVRWELED